MRKLTLTLFALSLSLITGYSQGFNIPAKSWGLSFGNSTQFNGLRFNILDKDIEKINGINFNVWGHKDESRQTGTVNGISIGIPAAMGTRNRNGINIGIFGAGTKNDMKGINLGGLGVGAGNNLSGINIGGLGAGAGGDVKGLSVSAFNHIQGDVFGVSIGIFNYAYAVRGLQLGILNHVKNNPKGLRWLPIFNTSFGS